MSNVSRIKTDHSVQRILQKIVAGQPLNEIEKALLRWSATQHCHPDQSANKSIEPAA
jgi:hypothetical protein